MKYDSEFYNFVNPAFCGEILRRCIKKYQSISSRTMPYSLAFLVLPIILSSESREKIDPYTQKTFVDWIRENGFLTMKFSKRVKQLIPITRETLLFLLQINAIKIDSFGNLTVHNYTLKGSFKNIESEIDDCFKKSEVIGKWFAHTSSPKLIFRMWGITP